MYSWDENNGRDHRWIGRFRRFVRGNFATLSLFGIRGYSVGSGIRCLAVRGARNTLADRVKILLDMNLSPSWIACLESGGHFCSWLTGLYGRAEVRKLLRHKFAHPWQRCTIAGRRHSVQVFPHRPVASACDAESVTGRLFQNVNSQQSGQIARCAGSPVQQVAAITPNSVHHNRDS